MTSTVFVDKQTAIVAAWLNDVNTATYGLVVNVSAAPFNAVGNGIADDTVALQAALNSVAPSDLSESHATIFFKSGATYLISAPLVVHGGYIKLQGNGCTIVTTTTINGDLISVGTGADSGSNGVGVQIENMYLNCNALAWHALRIVRGSAISIRNVVANKWTRSGFYVDASGAVKQLKNLLLDTCFATGTSNAIGYGFQFEESGGAAVGSWTGFVMLNCEVEGAAEAIRIESHGFTPRVAIINGVYQNTISNTLHIFGDNGTAQYPLVLAANAHFESGTGIDSILIEQGARLIVSNSQYGVLSDVTISTGAIFYESQTSIDSSGNTFVANLAAPFITTNSSLRNVANIGGIFPDIWSGRTLTVAQNIRLGLAGVNTRLDGMLSTNLTGVSGADTYQTVATDTYAGMEFYTISATKRGVRWIVSAAAQAAATPFAPTYAMTLSEVGSLTINGATAVPAGGTADTGLMFSTTAHFGVFFGSGAPTLSAAKGSLYLRSDGSGVGDRMYVNTNGTTGWTAVTTAA